MNLFALTTTLWLLQAASPTTESTPPPAAGNEPIFLTPTAAPAARPAPPAVKPAPPPKVDAPGIEGVPVKVERRQLVKARRTILGAGAAYFLRGDYFITPGLQATLSHYLDERNGLEGRAGFFVPFVTPAAQQVFSDLGFIPDVPAVLGGFQVGYRRSLGYGKVLMFGTADSLVHFDVQVAFHVGGVINARCGVGGVCEQGFGPSLSVAPALLARLGPSWTMQLDVALTGSLESAEFPVVFGVLPLLAVGYAF